MSIASLARSVRRRVLRARYPNCINGFEAKILSQNGEDGILREIFRRIGTTNRFFVEFGVETGVECNTALLSRRCGWSGLLIEGAPEKFAQLDLNYAELPQVQRLCAFVTRENIAELFARSGVPEEFDLLCIDIDGNDYWVWRELHPYRPRVVVIEYNAQRKPPELWIMPYNPSHKWDGNMDLSASLASMTELGSQLGYALVGTESKGVNAFFVRNDVLPDSGFPARTPEDAYHAYGY
ncbi:MAG: hypothetical protein DLM50_08480 [Candidatus Meridianibacter frigidus]|nr:MAG: hypothetical protein DLM50_08480 [Candidatus Eremiobacteraeota bacterium]